MYWQIQAWSPFTKLGVAEMSPRPREGSPYMIVSGYSNVPREIWRLLILTLPSFSLHATTIKSTLSTVTQGSELGDFKPFRIKQNLIA